MAVLKATDMPPTATVQFLGAGTAACTADLITFPLDTAKVWLQIQGESQGPVCAAASAQSHGMLGTILFTVFTEGTSSLYSRLVAGLQCQMSFASVRIGLYDFVKQFYTKGSEHASPNVVCNAIVNCAELVTYDLIKVALLKANLMTDDLSCHFTSAFGAGFGTTVITSPCQCGQDLLILSRYMNSALGQYSSAGHCALTMLWKEGRAFYKGFMPSFLRLGSWNMVMFVTNEQLKWALMAACTSLEAPF
ncbi:LOW QUALITY PROTEIN: dicarboxylate carrier SLC25A8-like [Erethizon dorsatum]